MNENYSLEELEAYLYGELSADKKKQIEEEIKINQSLQQELEVLRISREAVELAAWKSVIAEAQEEYLSEKKTVKLTPSGSSGIGVWIGRIAASFALVLAGAVTVLFFSTSPESITDSQLDYSIPVLRSGSDQSAEIEQAYQNGDFAQVISYSKDLNGYDAKASLLIGLAYLEENNGAKAAEYLTQIEQENLKSGSGDFADQVDYYLVKAYLMQGKITDAAVRIEKIRAEENHTYHDNFGQMDLIRLQILKWKN
jgi:hypothetical protein